MRTFHLDFFGLPGLPLRFLVYRASFAISASASTGGRGESFPVPTAGFAWSAVGFCTISKNVF